MEEAQQGSGVGLVELVPPRGWISSLRLLVRLWAEQRLAEDRSLAVTCKHMNRIKEPGRQRLPHLAPLEFANQAIIICVTQVVAKRRKLLARAEVLTTLLAAWQKADQWRVGRYVIMPDHLHLFCAPGRHACPPLSRWMAYWRKPIWQKGFFDRQIRSGETYTEKWHYVRGNPVRGGLVAEPDAWPWQGEMHTLMWHEPA